MWDLFKRIINLQSFFLRRLYHQICALRSDHQLSRQRHIYSIAVQQLDEYFIKWFITYLH
jgi:hypothetical protein